MRVYLSLSQITLSFLIVSNVALADNEPRWPVTLNINPIGIDYHNKEIPNSLECEVGQYEGRYFVSQKVNVDATKQTTYQFAYDHAHYYSKEFHFNYLSCHSMTSGHGHLTAFTCYDIAMPGTINVKQGITSGQCQASSV